MPPLPSAAHDDAAPGRAPAGAGPDLWLGHVLYRRRALAPGLIARRIAVIPTRPPIATGANPLSTRVMARYEAARAHLGRSSEVAIASTFPTLFAAGTASAPSDASSAASGPIAHASAVRPTISVGTPVVQRRAIVQRERAGGPLASAADVLSAVPPAQAFAGASAAALAAPPSTIAPTAATSPPVRARVLSRPEPEHDHEGAGDPPFVVRVGAARAAVEPAAGRSSAIDPSVVVVPPGTSTARSTAEFVGATPVVHPTPALSLAARERFTPRRAIGAPIRSAPPAAASDALVTATAGTPRGSDLGDLGASLQRVDALSWLPPMSGSSDPGFPDAVVGAPALPVVVRRAGREKPSGASAGGAPLPDRAPDLALTAAPTAPRASEPPVTPGEASRGPLAPFPAPRPPAPSNNTAPRPAHPRAPAKPTAPDIGELADRVYRLLVNRLADERRRRDI